MPSTCTWREIYFILFILKVLFFVCLVRAVFNGSNFYPYRFQPRQQIECSVLSSQPHLLSLHSLKLSIWLPCGTVLVECMTIRVSVLNVISVTSFDLIIIIMEICKAPTPQLKALNKHNVTHIMYIEMENVISSLTKTNT